MKRTLGITLVLVSLIMVGCGGWWLLQTIANAEAPAPRPTAEFMLPADEVPTAPSNLNAAGTVDTETGTAAVSPEGMAPSHLLIPALGVYAQVVDSGLVNGTSHVSGNPVRKLDLPGAMKVARSRGAATVAQDDGTLLLAGHVSSRGEKGALNRLVDLRPGEVWYVTDAVGNRAAFKMVGVGEVTVAKNQLPKDIWASTGQRRSVLVTCGGKVVETPQGRFYESNVLAFGSPVPELSSKQR